MESEDRDSGSEDFTDPIRRLFFVAGSQFLLVVDPIAGGGWATRFDERGHPTGEEDFVWDEALEASPDDQDIAVALVSLGVPQADADSISSELKAEGAKAKVELAKYDPHPPFFDYFVVAGFVLLTVGVWLCGLGFLVWLAVTKLF